jgi:hypothetical protein
MISSCIYCEVTVAFSINVYYKHSNLCKLFICGDGCACIKINVLVNKIPALTTCFEKELYICGYISLHFLFNTYFEKCSECPISLLKSVTYYEVCSDAVLLSLLLFMASFGYLSVFMALEFE